jgi:hypothetical protein
MLSMMECGLSCGIALLVSMTIVLAAFYADETGRMTFSAQCQDLPLDLVDWFIQKAREVLPPVKQIPAPQS